MKCATEEALSQALKFYRDIPVSYTHLRAHETR